MRRALQRTRAARRNREREKVAGPVDPGTNIVCSALRSLYHCPPLVSGPGRGGRGSVLAFGADRSWVKRRARGRQSISRTGMDEQRRGRNRPGIRADIRLAARRGEAGGAQCSGWRALASPPLGPASPRCSHSSGHHRADRAGATSGMVVSHGGGLASRSNPFAVPDALAMTKPGPVERADGDVHRLTVARRQKRA